ncbi:MAG: universal stress protein [Gemmatimonadaceae bacterium]
MLSTTCCTWWSPGAPAQCGSWCGEAWQARRRRSERSGASSTRGSLPGDGLRPVRVGVRSGTPNEELAEAAAVVGADTVVVGAQGHSRRPWKCTGSTAERLARATGRRC